MLRMAVSRRRMLIAAAAVAALAIAAWLWPASASLSFDRAAWLQAATNGSDPRHVRLRMARALVSSGDLVGLPVATVIQQLGPSADRTGFPPDALIYALGAADDAMPAVPAVLMLRVDPAGRVVEAGIMTG
jgi:hypothetical protein